MAITCIGSYMDNLTSELEDYTSMDKFHLTDAKNCIPIIKRIRIVLREQPDELEIDSARILKLLDAINIVLVHTIDVAEKIDHEDQVLKKEVEDLKIEMAKLKKEVETLKLEINKLKSAILLGQIAYKFEKTTLKIILKGTSDANDYKNLTLSQIEGVIYTYGRSRMAPDVLKSEKERKRADQNWDEFNTKHKVTGVMYGVLDKIKNFRNTTAHPKISIEDARISLQEYPSVSKERKKICEKMLDILKDLSENNLSY